MASISWRPWSIFIWPEDKPHELAGCNYYGCVVKEMVYRASKNFALWHIARPSLADTRFSVKVNGLNVMNTSSVKYHLSWLQSPFASSAGDLLPIIYWMKYILDRRYSGMGILLAIRWRRHTHYSVESIPSFVKVTEAQLAWYFNNSELVNSSQAMSWLLSTTKIDEGDPAR